MMTPRRSLAVTVMAVLALTAGRASALPVPQITDPMGDANGTGMTNQVTQMADPTTVDLYQVLWSTDRPGAKARNLTVRLSLYGPVCSPDNGCSPAAAAYTVSFHLGSCPMSVSYLDGVTATKTVKANVCKAGSATPESRTVTATTTDSAIIWTLPLASLKDTGLKVGARLTQLSAMSQLASGGSPTIVMDTASTAASYTVGS